MPNPTPPAAEPVEPKPVVAMIHVGALPGTPGHRSTLAKIVENARAEARLYQKCGVNCLIIENMHDVPYLRGTVGPEIVASMTLVAQAVRAETDLPLGIQILAAADIEAMAVAHAGSLDFIRSECFSFAHVADEGLMESNAARLLRYRRMIGATHVQVWSDIKKKHASHALTADLTLGDVAEAAEFMGAETLIVTGICTGRPPRAAEVEEARNHCRLPVFVGSGVSIENLAELHAVSDGLIIGSHFKRNGHWINEIDETRVRQFMAAITCLDDAATTPSGANYSVPVAQNLRDADAPRVIPGLSIESVAFAPSVNSPIAIPLPNVMPAPSAESPAIPIPWLPRVPPGSHRPSPSDILPPVPPKPEQ